MKKFKVGDNVVYPGHGVGQVEMIETKQILGTKHQFYHVKILYSGMKILVLVKTANEVGLRAVLSFTDAMKVRDILNSPAKVDIATWNARYREYMEKVKTGNPFDLAVVLRDISALEKELSFGERKIHDNAKALLLGELSLVDGLVVVP